MDIILAIKDNAESELQELAEEKTKLLNKLVAINIRIVALTTHIEVVGCQPPVSSR